MSSALIIILGALRLTSLQQHNYTSDAVYYKFPHFWTYTGFCPGGNPEEIRNALQSESVWMNMRQIAAMPTGAIKNIRIHWLLELLDFTGFTQSGIPIFDFTNLDDFVMNLDDLGLYPVIEFMGNPGELFEMNPQQNGLYWENLAYQIVKHYLNILGAKKLLEWQFESWNEPDLRTYNKLNFTSEDFWTYASALEMGLAAAGRRGKNSLNFQLRGPAGLFKSENVHPLCWKILEKCNENMDQCPYQVITYHRKGKGRSSDIIEESSDLLRKLYEKFPSLQMLPISNDEADPISSWSTPRDFQADVGYALILASIVVDHWMAKINRPEFQNLQSISHDNAFLSYHPYEFTQRTLLAHFRMNQSDPVHSQFIQKPVYAALGMLSRLGDHAAADVKLQSDNQLRLLKTVRGTKMPLMLTWLMLPAENASFTSNFTWKRDLSFAMCEDETYHFIVEVLETNRTDPVHLWRSFGSPSYPNGTEREIMRRAQVPRILTQGVLTTPSIEIGLGELRLPWLLMLRICSNLVTPPQPPVQLSIVDVSKGEVFVSWRENGNVIQCLKSYEVWHRSNETSESELISLDWHLPFPSFQFAPSSGQVNGFYRVRALDIMGQWGSFSQEVEYYEV